MVSEPLAWECWSLRLFFAMGSLTILLRLQLSFPLSWVLETFYWAFHISRNFSCGEAKAISHRSYGAARMAPRKVTTILWVVAQKGKKSQCSNPWNPLIWLYLGKGVAVVIKLWRWVHPGVRAVFKSVTPVLMRDRGCHTRAQRKWREDKRRRWE